MPCIELAVTRTTDGLPTLMVAVAIALALAAGVVFGEYLAQPVRTGLGRLERPAGRTVDGRPAATGTQAARRAPAGVAQGMPRHE